MEPSKNHIPARAGQYVHQPNGYKAFTPAPLPPNPPVQLEKENLQALLSDADRALGRLDGAIQMLPDSDLFVFMYIRKEAVLSSQIEGTQSSLQDVLAAEAEIFAPDRPKDVGEVINHVRAMNHGLRRLDELSVSVRLIQEIHAELLQGVRGSDRTPGKLRTNQNWIGPNGCTLGEAIFVPPPYQEVPRQLAALEQFLRTDTELPLLIKIGLAHAQFETIHPFSDGNGRVGRLLITLLLCEQKVLHKPVLYLSHFFTQNQQQYYKELQSVRDASTWEQWLAFFLCGVRAVSDEAAMTVRKILLLREVHRALITYHLGRAAGNGYRVLEYLYTHPIISIKEVQRLIGTTNASANTLITRMVKIGLLREITGQARNRKFAYEDYIKLFHDSKSES